VTLPNEYSLYDSVTHVIRYLVVGTSKVPLFFFGEWHHWLAHHKNPKNVANGTCPKHLYYSFLILILLFVSQDQNWRQRIWDKARCYWEHVGNPVGTWWDHIGKIVLPAFSKEKKNWALGCMRAHLLCSLPFLAEANGRGMNSRLHKILMTINYITSTTNIMVFFFNVVAWKISPKISKTHQIYTRI
jgi:hypothetical protein